MNDRHEWRIEPAYGNPEEIMSFLAEHPQNMATAYRDGQKTARGKMRVYGELHQESDNTYDPNAVLIRIDGTPIGYISAAVAKVLAPRLRNLRKQGIYITVPIILDSERDGRAILPSGKEYSTAAQKAWEERGRAHPPEREKPVTNSSAAKWQAILDEAGYQAPADDPAKVFREWEGPWGSLPKNWILTGTCDGKFATVRSEALNKSLASRKAQLTWVIALVVLGLATAVAIIGFLFLVAAPIYYRMSKTTNKYREAYWNRPRRLIITQAKPGALARPLPAAGQD